MLLLTIGDSLRSIPFNGYEKSAPNNARTIPRAVEPKVMTEVSGSLPSYENPPVIEVVCGLLFKPIERLLAPHLGLLWERFKPEYPRCQEIAPLMPVIERFDDSGSRETQLQVSDVPPLPRIWFVHSAESGIIQVQRDRFLHNWKKVRPEDEYPRYHNVIEIFRDRLWRFESFLKESELGAIHPLQYEMTYVNHILQGEGWTSVNDIGKLFPDFSWRSTEERFLPGPTVINLRTTFPLPNRSGRLHVTIRNAKRHDDGHPLLLFELTSRGFGRDNSPEAMWAWFDLAREWIVRGFADLTSEEVQRRVWMRTR